MATKKVQQLLLGLVDLPRDVAQLEDPRALRYYKGLLTDVHSVVTAALKDAKNHDLGDYENLSARLMETAGDLQELAAIIGKLFEKQEAHRKAEEDIEARKAERRMASV